MILPPGVLVIPHLLQTIISLILINSCLHILPPIKQKRPPIGNLYFFLIFFIISKARDSPKRAVGHSSRNEVMTMSEILGLFALIFLILFIIFAIIIAIKK